MTKTQYQIQIFIRDDWEDLPGKLFDTKEIALTELHNLVAHATPGSEDYFQIKERHF